MPVPTNTDPTTATVLVSGTTIAQQVDDSGTTYDVYYKYTNATAVDQVISIGHWGDLGGGGTYHPDCNVYIDVLLADAVANSFPDGSFTIPIPAGATYWFEFTVVGNYTPSNLNIKTLVGPSTIAAAGDLFIRSATMAQFQIDAGLTGLHAGIIRDTDALIIGFVPQFITGETGDILDSGRMLFADEAGSYDGFPPPDPTFAYWFYLFDSEFEILTRVAVESSSLPPLNRTHLPTQTFYVLGRNTSTSYTYYTVDADGVLTSLGTFTSSAGTVTALAVDETETYLYVGMRQVSGANFITKVRRWNMGTLAFDSDLFADAAGSFSTRFKVTDILVLLDDTVIVCLFKSSNLTMEVRRYDNAGSLLNTYTFTFASALQVLDPRLGYSSQADAFWVFNHLDSGYADIRLIRTDGTELVASLTPDVEQSDDPQADPPLPYTSNSCPIIELRVAFAGGGGLPEGIIGPLAWIEMTRRGQAESAGAPTLTHFYSDHDMQCPAIWYGGFKEGRVTQWSTATRTLSDPWTGDWQGSTVMVSLSDYDLSIRQRLASATDRYWTTPSVIRMTTRANRAVLGIPYTVFVGPMVDAQPTRGSVGFDLTLGDSVSNGLLSDEFQLPWRQVRDSFLTQLDEIAESLDVDTPVPIIYGEHRRVPGVDPASPQGFIYRPTYLGIQTLVFGQCHVWLVAGHALADILDVYIDDGANPISSVLADEGTKWLVPHFGGWAAEFLGAPYVDYVSDTYATYQRYSLIYGLVGQTDPDNCAAEDGWAGPAGGPAPTGSTKLLVAVQGVEPVGDGSGAVITDRFQQYKHFVTNFIVYQGLDSYQTGNWLPVPEWSLYDINVPVVDEDSFDACSAIGELRLPAFGSPPTTPGYIGAAIIGARAGDRQTARDWIAQWNRSCACRFGITHYGRLRIAVLHPTAAIKAAAPLFTDGYEILDQSFQVDVRWGDQANTIPFKADYEHSSGQWQTVDIAIDYTAQGLYGRTITAEAREYPFAPGITMANHLAQLELRLRAYPPRYVTLSTNVDADHGMGMMELGEYFRYVDYATIAGSPAEIRLAQVQSLSIHPGTRQVTVTAIDCDDHLDYDTAE